MITDSKAEELEQRGLWRRAAARWQELLLIHQQDDSQMFIRQRLEFCQKQAKRKRHPPSQESTYNELRQATVRTEKNLGIYRSPREIHNGLFRHRKQEHS
ncbi:TPA: PerC family transcriptional regulator [Escherichia coli]